MFFISLEAKNKREPLKRFFQGGLYFLFLLVLIFFFFWYASQLSLLSGFPKGRDVYAYLFRIRFVKLYFPHINWNYLWDAGTPFFIWSHPPLPTLIPAFLSGVFGLTEASALNLVAALMFCLFFLSFFGFLSLLTKNKLLSLASTIFLLANPAIWGWWADGGNYIRVVALGFFGLAIFFTSLCLERKDRGEKTKWFYLSTIFFFHLCLTSHFLIGVFVSVVISFLIVFSVPGFINKVKEEIKIFFPAFCLSAYFLIPFLFSGKPVGFLGKTWTLKRILFKHLVSIDPEQPFSSWDWPFLAGVGVSLLILIVFSLFKRRSDSSSNGRLLKAGFLTSLILGVPAVVYLVMGNFEIVPYEIFINGLPPASAIVIPTILLTILVATSLQASVNKFSQKKIRVGVSLISSLFLGLLIFSLVSKLPVFKEGVFDINLETPPRTKINDEYQRHAYFQVIKQADKPENYRFGTNSAYVADWFNFYYPKTPQTRDFFAQGVPYPDWTFLLEQTVWSEREKMAETKFWLDWYGVKNFFVDQNLSYPEKFLAEPSFKIVASNFEEEQRRAGLEFEYLEATPILAPNNSPTMLIVSGEEEYKILIRNLTFKNLGASRIIPLDGGERVKPNLYYLKNFDLLFLYGYTDGQLEKISRPIEEFVKQGGKLVIETNPDQDLKREKTSLPSFYPLDEFEMIELEDWHLKGSGDFINYDFSNFAPSQYEGYPWKGAKTRVAQVRDWAQPLVFSGNQVLVVGGQLGEGKVIWSGVNLPFHAEYHQNFQEIEFLAKLWLGEVEKSETTTEENYSVEVINPEKHAIIETITRADRRSIILNQRAEGVLFKESFFPSWKAKVHRNGKGQGLKIFPAGPSLMYVFLGEIEDFPARVVFEYHLSWLEITSRVLSLVAFFLMVDFVFGSRVMQAWQKPILKRWRELKEEG